MSVKPELAFDVCWEVYRGAREVLETKRGISALKLGKAGKFLWRPDVQARLNEWGAGFALAGEGGPGGAGGGARMGMFLVCFLCLAAHGAGPPFPGVGGN